MSRDRSPTVPGPAAFPPTRHSVIARIRSTEAAVRRDAFGDLVSGYWKPVYKHLRLTWQLPPEDAEDLTQALFTEAFEKGWFEAYDPARARFRTFVRVCADRLIMNWRQSAGRQKRGGDAISVPLDFPGAEREVTARGASKPPDADEFFRQEFLREVFGRALVRLRAECEARGWHDRFRLFERSELDRDGASGYDALAVEFGLTMSQVTNHLARIRRRFRGHALDALRSLTGGADDFRAEARELFGLEVE